MDDLRELPEPYKQLGIKAADRIAELLRDDETREEAYDAGVQFGLKMADEERKGMVLVPAECVAELIDSFIPHPAYTRIWKYLNNDWPIEVLKAAQQEQSDG